MVEFSIFGPLGVLPLALLLLLQLSLDLGWLLFGQCARRVRVLGGIVWVLAGLVVLLQILFHANWLFPPSLFVALASASILVHVLRRKRSPQVTTFEDLRGLFAKPGPVEAVALLGLALLGLAIYLLPVWQWDSLGYHLPFVGFVLQGGGKAELPVDVPYLSTYPRNVELLFVALRATLPDDRLVDLGQLPLGLVCAVSIAALARELGATLPHARIAGSAFLTLPAVFLQLPTNYIDVGVAAFYLLAAFFIFVPPTKITLLTAGLAIGLFLGTKPNTPPAAFLLGLVLVVRAYRSKRMGAGLVAIGLSGVVGLEAYVIGLVRYQNPVWPAIVHLGPFELPGTISVEELLDSGAGTQKVHGPLLVRMLRSWSTFDSLPVFDMRVGGLGPLFWLALPLAIVLMVRLRSKLLPALVAISLVTPDPAVVRYILPLPGLLFAAAAAAVTVAARDNATANAPHVSEKEPASRLRRVPRSWLARGALGLVAALCVYNLAYAAPGLTGEGPPLLSYWEMTWDERARAVGANGRPDKFIRARQLLGPGEVAVYDKSFALPYLLWRPDLSNKVVRVPDAASPKEALRIVNNPQVRLVAAGTDQPILPAVGRANEPFRSIFPCPESCIVFARR